MKILTAQQLYEADKYTIEQQEISSLELMERAAESLFQWLHQRLQGAPVKIHLFCGIGNNGGDGVALARHLWEHGYNIQVYIVNYSDKRSPDFLANLERLKERKIWPEFINESSSMPALTENDFIVDAIFGIGLNRPPASWVASLIDYINGINAFILSVDIPSGLFVDKAITQKKGIIEADFVLAIQAPKLVFYLPETSRFVQDWDVIDIGMDRMFLQSMEVKFEEFGKMDLLKLYKPRSRFAHKGNFGHALVIGGSHGKVGAVSLTAEACIRTGAGLVTVLVPGCGYIPLQTRLPEIMVLTDAEENWLADLKFNFEPAAIGLGIGMGTAEATKKGFETFLKTNKTPLVIDADAINILAGKPALLPFLKGAILTPHPGELERLIGSWKDDFEKLDKVFAFVEKYNCTLVVKGANTMIVGGGKGYINRNGNPGMATAGSGDVLTGIITGLLSQGYDRFTAARLGVYIHGLSGDLNARDEGFEAVTASGIISRIGKAYLEFLRPPEPVVPVSDPSEEE